MEPILLSGYNSTRCNSTRSANSSVSINQNTVITDCRWLSVTMCYQLPCILRSFTALTGHWPPTL